MGNDGQDFIFLGTDMGSEVFAGTGNDFIYGNKNAERILGNEGDDWIETGTFDGAPGDNFDEIFSHDEIDGNDVFLGDGGFDEFIGEGGDDIFIGSPGRGKMVGMSGFDWANYKDNASFVNADLSIPIVFDEAPTLPQNAALDEYELVEGLSGTKFNDVLKGSNTLAEERLPVDPNNPAASGTEGYQGSFLDAQGIALINGLQGVLGAGVNFFNAGDIILGGKGSDRIQGNAGDDIIDGDKWLNVRIGIMSGFNENGPTGAERTFELVNGAAQEIRSMTSPVTLRLNAEGAEVATGGTLVTKPLSAWMFEGRFNPGQLQIIREIKTDTTVGDVDTAVFQGARGEYAFSATADGQVIVTHAIENSLDGTDRLRNIEKVEFSDGGALNIIVGTAWQRLAQWFGGTMTSSSVLPETTRSTALPATTFSSAVLAPTCSMAALATTPTRSPSDDGNDTINEPVNATTSGGLADRISILAPNAIDPVTGLPVIDPATGLPVPTLTSLNASDNNTGTQDGDLVITYGLPTGATTSVNQQVTVANHFDGNVAGTGVERINFNGATVYGYLLGAEDYAVSRLDPANRTDPINGVNLSISTANNFVVGEHGYQRRHHRRHLATT